MPSLSAAEKNVSRGAYEIHVWGTVLYIEAASSVISRGEIDRAIEDVKSFVTVSYTHLTLPTNREV